MPAKSKAGRKVISVSASHERRKIKQSWRGLDMSRVIAKFGKGR